jgi:hypothetical protein
MWMTVGALEEKSFRNLSNTALACAIIVACDREVKRYFSFDLFVFALNERWYDKNSKPNLHEKTQMTFWRL